MPRPLIKSKSIRPPRIPPIRAALALDVALVIPDDPLPEASVGTVTVTVKDCWSDRIE